MPHKITRRGLLSAGTLAGVSTALSGCNTPKDGAAFSASSQRATGTFAHGIASGDPRADSVILWTRITPTDANGGPVKLLWEISPTARTAMTARKWRGKAICMSRGMRLSR